METKIVLRIGKYETVLHLYETSAPDVYDGGGTFTITEYNGVRLVAIPKETVGWQVPRYRSGLHGTRPYDMDSDDSTFFITENEIVNQLLSRISSRANER